MLNVQNPYPKGEDKSPKVVYDAAAVVDLDHHQYDVTVKLEVLLLGAIIFWNLKMYFEQSKEIVGRVS